MRSFIYRIIHVLQELPYSAAQQPSPDSRKNITSTCKVEQKLSPFADMLLFGVTIPATVPQWSNMPEGIMNYPV
jgi:hypothetical protein